MARHTHLAMMSAQAELLRKGRGTWSAFTESQKLSRGFVNRSARVSVSSPNVALTVVADVVSCTEVSCPAGSYWVVIVCAAVSLGSKYAVCDCTRPSL
jgi:hypothetical protein